MCAANPRIWGIHFCGSTRRHIWMRTGHVEWQTVNLNLKNKPPPPCEHVLAKVADRRFSPEFIKVRRNWQFDGHSRLLFKLMEMR